MIHRLVKCGIYFICFVLLLFEEETQGWLLHHRQRQYFKRHFRHTPHYEHRSVSRAPSGIYECSVCSVKYNNIRERAFSIMMMTTGDEPTDLDNEKGFDMSMDPDEALTEYPVAYFKEKVNAYYANLTAQEKNTSNYSESGQQEDTSNDVKKEKRRKLRVPWKNLVPTVVSNKYDSHTDDKDEPNDRMSWFDPADIGYLDLRPEGFADSYVAVGIFSGDYFRSRSMLWDYHLQWIRRTQLMRYLPLHASNITESGICSVDKAMTLLSFDRLMPSAQVMFLSSNSTDDVMRYMRREPFAKEGLVEWKICKMNRVGVDIDALHEIPRAPYLFLHMNGQLSKRSEATHPYYQDLSRESQNFYKEASISNDKSLRFDIFSRVSFFGELSNLDEHQIGEVLMFNAKSHSDALNFIRRTPMGKVSKVDENLLYRAIVDDNRNLTILGAINMLDCDGRAKSTYFNTKESPNYQHMGDESPEELLYQFKYRFDDAHAREHHQENKRVLEALRKYNITIDIPNSFYDQPDTIQTDLENFEKSLIYITDQTASASAYRILEEDEGIDDNPFQDIINQADNGTKNTNQTLEHENKGTTI